MLSQTVERMNFHTEEVKKKPVDAFKNKQDSELRQFKGDVAKFLKLGRGWFPHRLPSALSKALLQ